MSHPPVWSSAAFRLALAYTGLFLLSSLALFGFIYWYTTGHMLEQADLAIQTEIQGLKERYEEQGTAGLTRVIAGRIARNRAGSSVYLLTNRRLRPLLGNLDSWPTEPPGEDGWLDFALGGFGTDGRLSHHARARVFRLSGGLRLLVGRDMHQLDEADHRVLSALGWGALITALLGVLGGSVLSRAFLRRIGAINQTAREIMQGQLNRRIPTKGNDDDLDLLACNLNAMLDRIQELMEDIRQVSDNIAHDLRTPLSRLRGRLETLRQTRTWTADECGLVEGSLNDADNLLATFNALLRIARIETGERKSGFSKVDLSAICVDIVELYQPAAEHVGLALEAKIGHGLFISGDRDLIFQALSNVLDNAIKYARPGGCIDLSLSMAGDKGIAVSVADSGPGIPAKDREAVLKRFYRLEKHRSTPGNGLGLSLVAAVAQLHSSTLTLGDNHPGLVVTWAFNVLPTCLDSPPPPSPA